MLYVADHTEWLHRLMCTLMVSYAKLSVHCSFHKQNISKSITHVECILYLYCSIEFLYDTSVYQ